MTITPTIFPEVGQHTAGELPVCREVAWDTQRNIPLFRHGRPVVVEQQEAIKTWIWKALHTQRYRWPIYTWEYGSELEELIGWSGREDVKTAEVTRRLQECLLTNPYITGVKHIHTEFDGSTLAVSCTVVTIYGEVTVYANL